MNDTSALNLDHLEHLDHLDDKLVVKKPVEIMAPKKLILKRNMESVKENDEEDVQIELPKTLAPQLTNSVSVEDSNSYSEPIPSKDVSEPKKIKLSLSTLSEKEVCINFLSRFFFSLHFFLLLDF